MVVLDECEMETEPIPSGFVVNLGEETAIVAVFLRGHDLDRWYCRLFDLHRLPHWRQEAQAPAQTKPACQNPAFCATPKSESGRRSRASFYQNRHFLAGQTEPSQRTLKASPLDAGSSLSRNEPSVELDSASSARTSILSNGDQRALPRFAEVATATIACGKSESWLQFPHERSKGIGSLFVAPLGRFGQITIVE
jgi:hypothetical protein